MKMRQKLSGISSHLEEDAGVGIDIGPWVLSLALLQENARDDLVELGDELEKFVIGQVLEGELALALVAGIRLAEHGMTVA